MLRRVKLPVSALCPWIEIAFSLQFAWSSITSASKSEHFQLPFLSCCSKNTERQLILSHLGRRVAFRSDPGQKEDLQWKAEVPLLWQDLCQFIKFSHGGSRQGAAPVDHFQPKLIIHARSYIKIRGRRVSGREELTLVQRTRADTRTTGSKGTLRNYPVAGLCASPLYASLYFIPSTLLCARGTLITALLHPYYHPLTGE